MYHLATLSLARGVEQNDCWLGWFSAIARTENAVCSGSLKKQGRAKNKSHWDANRQEFHLTAIFCCESGLTWIQKLSVLLDILDNYFRLPKTLLTHHQSSGVQLKQHNQKTIS
jgi:hypothetical protein